MCHISFIVYIKGCYTSTRFVTMPNVRGDENEKNSEDNRLNWRFYDTFRKGKV